MIPSPISSPLQNSPQFPAFHNLGKSFLIDNLLRINGPSSPPLRPIPATLVPVKVPQTAEQISPSGGPHPTRPSFQLVNPSDSQSAPVTSTSQIVPYPEIALSKCFQPRFPQFFLSCCGGSCQQPVSPTAFPSKCCDLPLWPQVSHSKARKGILRRVVFSEEQRKALEKTFQKQKYISKTDRKKLATNLGLKDSQVKIWFQNRRMKWRNTKERELLAQECVYEQPLQEKSLSASEQSDNKSSNAPDRKYTEVGEAFIRKYVTISPASQYTQTADRKVPDLKLELTERAPCSESVQCSKDSRAFMSTDQK
ncbi:homeobox protein DBX2 [Callorhinchus milii]|uniref:homeobox protein DBX2 n=1 Tax=Callorhinchus milii TaxID=7868 RepID=UPI0004571459|nr:homeobox protein DBX2 [Callorhinchus milii]|eukprot:gi/632937985/ref/XP_007901828.1/ PREDICTED: homeobox protein DBX2 [Callorhinchus milii]